ncbi:hypothetical protein K8R43_00880 [archaeon]|nr:hypothetical protein [archaeon]
MKRGQLSAEFILASMLILFASFVAFQMYQSTAFQMIAESSMVTSVNWEVAKAPLDHPACGHAYLGYPSFHRNVTHNETLASDTVKRLVSNYSVNMTDDLCVPILFDSAAQNLTNGLISVSLGCRYEDQGYCKGFIYHVHD